jgi:hypothetical protein
MAFLTALNQMLLAAGGRASKCSVNVTFISSGHKRLLLHLDNVNKLI